MNWLKHQKWYQIKIQSCRTSAFDATKSTGAASKSVTHKLRETPRKKHEKIALNGIASHKRTNKQNVPINLSPSLHHHQHNPLHHYLLILHRRHRRGVLKYVRHQRQKWHNPLDRVVTHLAQ